MTKKKHPPAMVMKAKPSKQEIRNQITLESKLTASDLPDEAKLVNVSLSPPTIPSQTVVNDEKTEKKPIDLDEFTQKQKYMEEQNRVRKEQVAKALEDRTKRTLQEQQKLVAIQDEFKKLDDSLSNDVKILRKQIENASYDYTEAQKKYHKIEKEFLNAKMHLHQRLEKKEMLTEHLCAIIEKNEERKAEKLNELLAKLEILDCEADADTNANENGKIQDSEISSNQ